MGFGHLRRLAVMALALLAGGAHAEAIVGCEPRHGLEPICGFQGSEDIEVLPGEAQLIVSQSRVSLTAAGRMEWKPSSLAAFDVARRLNRVLYPLGPAAAAEGDWGDVDCLGEIGTALSPHGIHLSRRSGGEWQLLVVNHGIRESVEMFEVTGSGDDLGLKWRGCAMAPAHVFFNDTAALPGDEFLVTVMMDARETMATAAAKARQGQDSGYVLRWTRAGGFVRVHGSESPLTNGIQASKDGRVMFIDVAGEVRKIDLATGRLLGVAKVPNPDNLSWTRDGKLLTAGLQKDANVAPCMADFRAPCGAAFNVFVIDADTMQAKLLLAHEGAPMGMATVAVEAGDSLYLGSAAGDRIVRFPLTAAGKPGR